MKRNRYVRKTQDVEALCAMALSAVGVIGSVCLGALFVREALRGIIP